MGMPLAAFAIASVAAVGQAIRGCRLCCARPATGFTCLATTIPHAFIVESWMQKKMATSPGSHLNYNPMNISKFNILLLVFCYIIEEQNYFKNSIFFFE